MKHPETRKQIPGAKAAVMFIHGIVGTPDHFRNMVPLEASVPEHWSVYNLRLPGHGGNVGDFAHSSMCEWKRHVWEAFAELAKDHEKVILVGHSMGTLFALQLAAENPEKVAGLFLLACPMRPCLRISGIGNMLRLTFGGIREDRPVEAATKAACGVEPTARIWRYIAWIPRFLELFSEIGRTEKMLHRLDTPCLAWQSRRDELVMGASRKVLEKVKAMEVRILPDSTHFYYADGDQQRLIREFEKFCAAMQA